VFHKDGTGADDLVVGGINNGDDIVYSRVTLHVLKVSSKVIASGRRRGRKSGQDREETSRIVCGRQRTELSTANEQLDAL
jgi:hypothetical protein